MVDLTATATDNIGVSRVEFVVNGNHFSEIDNPPWVLHWNSNAFPTGTYNWRAVAFDAAGNSATSAGRTYTHGLPTSGLRVVMTTTGVSPDSDGYSLSINGVPHAVPVNDSITIAPLVSGGAQLVLSGLADNCGESSPNPVAVTLTVNAETRIALAVVCQAPPVLNVIVATTGTSLDPDGYELTIRGASHAVTPQDTLELVGLSAGAAEVAVSGLSSNCSLAGSNPVPVTLALGTTTQVALAISCVLRETPLLVAIHTTGRNLDPDGYSLSFNGGVSQQVAGNDTVLYSNLADGTYTLNLTGMATNCAAIAPMPMPVAVTFADTNRMELAVRCLGSLTGRVVFGEGYEDNTPHLWSANPDGTGREQITIDPTEFFALPSVSPDGQSILYFGGVNQSALRVIHWDGTNAHNVPLGAEPDLAQVTWSPDGSKILFQRGSQIWVANADGSGQFELDAASGLGAGDPCWSPNGSQIADTRDGQLYIMQADGTNPHPIAVPGIVGHQCSWSPDGARLAFTDDGAGSIATIGIDGTQLVTFPLPGQTSRPYWSPDGTQLLFQFFDVGPVQIYRMQVDGSGTINVSNSQVNAYFPGWGP